MGSFSNSFSDSFKTGAAIGASGALETMKEKIKQENETAKSTIMIGTLQDRVLQAHKSGDIGQEEASAAYTALGKMKKSKLESTEVATLAKLAMPNLFDTKKDTGDKNAMVVERGDSGNYQVRNAITGTLVTDPSQVPTGSKFFKETMSADEYGNRISAGEQAKFLGPKEVASRSFELRQELQNLPVVKEFQTVKNQVDAMDALVKSSSGDDKKNSYLATDQGVITLFNKITDPTSVVRESEYDRTPKNLSLANRFSGAFEKWKSGGAGLTQDDREALLFGAKLMANSRAKNYNEVISNYDNLATNFGLDSKLVTSGYGKFEGYNDIVPKDSSIKENKSKKLPSRGDAPKGAKGWDTEKGWIM